MKPLPFALPAVCSLEALQARPDLAVVQVYEGAPVAAARAAVIELAETAPGRAALVVVELEPGGTTFDGWEPRALLALFEGVGASALALACPGDLDTLHQVLAETAPYARIPLGALTPTGQEAESLPLLAPAALLISPDGQGASALEEAAARCDFYAALPPPWLEGGEQEDLLVAVSGGRAHYLDAAYDLEAEFDLSDGDGDLERWLLEQEERGIGGVRLRLWTEDDVQLLSEVQYLITEPLALVADDGAILAAAARVFCGIALYDGTGGLEAGELAVLQEKYGLLVL